MWEDYYDRVVRRLGLGVPIVPLDGVNRPDFAPAGEQVELKTNKANNLFQPGDALVITVVNRSARDQYIELVGTSVRGRKVVLVGSGTVVKAGEEYQWPARGQTIKIQPQLGKEQITLYASPIRFAPGQLLRISKKDADAGRVVIDRYVHSFYTMERDGQRFKLPYDPAQVVKKTIEIETR
jgi:hypothetical protein